MKKESQLEEMIRNFISEYPRAIVFFTGAVVGFIIKTII
jgi:hypothetical protein